MGQAKPQNIFKSQSSTFITRAPEMGKTRRYDEGLIGLIEERVALETTRISIEEILRLYDNVSCGYHSLDKEGTFIRVNNTELEWLGYTQDEIIAKKKFSEILTPHSSKIFQEKFAHFKEREGIRDLELELIRKDGTTFPVLLSTTIIKDLGGNYVMNLSALSDISERRQIKEMQVRQVRQTALRADIRVALADRTVPLRHTLECCAKSIVNHLDAACVQIWTLNRERNELGLQASAGISDAHTCRLVGEDDLVFIAQERQPYVTNDAQSDPVISDSEWAKREGVIAFASYPLIADDKLVGVMAMFVRHKITNDTLNALGSITDIISQALERRHTEEKLNQIEEQLRQSQKMEAIGRLAGGMAHDFNNLLTAIIGYSQIVLETFEQDDPRRSAIEEINNAGNRAAALTSQLLIFCRKQVLQPQVLDLNSVVIGIEKMLRRLISEDIELTIGLDPELCQVKADAGQIEQIIMNLAINARDAMPQGGKLIIETANVVLDELYASQHLDVLPGSYVMLAVSDTGIGMDRETLSRIFEPFFTTKDRGEGTGLGLSTVYGIMKQNGGHVRVYTESGQGTTFKIYLPLLKEAVKIEKVESVKVALTQGSETILLVEDDETVRRLLRGALQKNGYSVLDAPTPADACKICQLYKGRIHLMLTDIVMPGMSGRELAGCLKSAGKEINVLYMSGYTDDTIFNHGIIDANTPFISKPFTPETLVRKVREVLDMHIK